MAIEYSAEELANASTKDLDKILDNFDIGSDYSKYFAKFDETQIENIKKNLSLKMSGLSQKSQNIIGQATQQIGKVEESKRQSMKTRGFEGAGDVVSDLNAQKGGILGGYTAAQQGINLQEQQASLGAEMDMKSAYEDYQDKFMSQLSNVESQIMSDPESDPEYVGRQGFNLFGSNNPNSKTCVVSTALNDSGAWSDSEKRDAVKWCQDTHHDGSQRGKAWVKGYHTWGKFLSKWVKKSNIIRWVVDTTTTAFVDHTKRNKKNYLGWMIHHLWINPLSYIIGYSKKNKIIGNLATFGLIGIYTLLFPLFAIASIPHVIKEKYGSRI
tara:strand:- start:8566 stop:9543 length:978 start_codon:yes stop_codon:yes gene_type:complete